MHIRMHVALNYVLKTVDDVFTTATAEAVGYYGDGRFPSQRPWKYSGSGKQLEI